MAAAYCHKCGAKLLSGAEFCASCGTSIGQGDDRDATAAEAPPKNREEPTTGRQLNRCPTCQTINLSEASRCKKCGTALVVADEGDEPEGAVLEVPRKVESATHETASPTPAGLGLIECPGCHSTRGMPGALCPSCGSRYPSPGMVEWAVGVAAIGGFLLLVALIAKGHLLNTDDSGFFATVEGLGWLGVIAAVALAVYGSGRVGPEQQSSCCGCSCVVALILLPAAGAALWGHGGPLMACLAIPAWLPLVRVIDGIFALSASVATLARATLTQS
jgi:zinc ribbon protein